MSKNLITSVEMGLENFMATPKQEREAFDLCGIVTRTERRIYYTL